MKKFQILQLISILGFVNQLNPSVQGPMYPVDPHFNYRWPEPRHSANQIPGSRNRNQGPVNQNLTYQKPATYPTTYQDFPSIDVYNEHHEKIAKYIESKRVFIDDHYHVVGRIEKRNNKWVPVNELTLDTNGNVSGGNIIGEMVKVLDDNDNLLYYMILTES